MITRIQKWGNSQGLRLSKQVLENVCISVGDDVDVTARHGLIVIAPTKRIRGKVSLKELVSLLPLICNPAMDRKAADLGLS